jgi:hypothetical protein
VTRLHHVNVVVAPGCTETVVEFYELLGLARVDKPLEGVASTGAWFDFPGGSQQLHVSEREGDRHAEQHFALVVDDLDALVAALRDDGHPFDRKPDLLGARRGMTADPAGNGVELIEATGAFSSPAG